MSEPGSREQNASRRRPAPSGAGVSNQPADRDDAEQHELPPHA